MKKIYYNRQHDFIITTTYLHIINYNMHKRGQREYEINQIRQGEFCFFLINVGFFFSKRYKFL